MAEKKTHNFNIELLKNGDQAEWNNFYNKLKGILKAKAFEKNIDFEPDVFNDTMIILMQEKMQSIKNERDLVNLCFAVYRNQKLNTYNKAARFANRAYIQGDDGLQELTPELIASPEIQQEEFIEAEQFECDLELLKKKLSYIQSKLNINNHAKEIDLYGFLLDYTSDHKKSLQDLCDEYNLNNDRNLRNLLLTLKKGLGMKKKFKKARTPFDQLKASTKSSRKKNFNKR